MRKLGNPLGISMGPGARGLRFRVQGAEKRNTLHFEVLPLGLFSHSKVQKVS